MNVKKNGVLLFFGAIFHLGGHRKSGRKKCLPGWAAEKASPARGYKWGPRRWCAQPLPVGTILSMPKASLKPWAKELVQRY